MPEPAPETPALGTTQYYQLPLWGPTNHANVRTTINASAIAMDTALHQAVADAAAAGATAGQNAASPYATSAANSATAAGNSATAAAASAASARNAHRRASFLLLGA